MGMGGEKRGSTLRGRNGVALPGDVLTPQSNTVSTNPDRGSGRRPDRSARINWPFEIMRICFGLLGILAGLILIVICIGIAYVSNMMVGVLKDIAQRDYSEATDRTNTYAARFSGMNDAGFRVQNSDPKILDGTKTFLWVVTPPGSNDRIVYRWKHHLQTNTVDPLTNPALLLDIALGYETVANAQEFGFYDPEDKLALALAQRDYGSIRPDQLIEQSNALPSGPVLAPKLTPDEARSRRGATVEEPEEDAAATGEANTVQPGEATEVGGAAAPPRGEGDGTDVGGGGESGGGTGVGGAGDGGSAGGDGGGSTPPHDDAIPVG